MNVYVFDKSFNMLGVVDDYTSLIWSREYYNIGTVEMHSKVNEHTLSILQKGNILVKENNLTEAMYIDSIYMDYQHYETMIVKGFSIDNFLDDRCVWGTQTYIGTIEDVMRSFVDINCISVPGRANRKILNLYLGVKSNIQTQASEVNSWSKVSELMKELALKYDVGWRIKFDRENRRYVFEVYRGKDSSLGQDLNPHAIFANEYENIFNQSYTDSDTNLKTTAIVAGTGDDPNRVVISINDNLSGWSRKELFVDAKDISDKDEENNQIPPATYIQMLTERGKTKLAESETTRTFESDVSILSNLSYRKDFDLGDKVSVENKKWGIVLNTRITSVEEVYENNTTSIRVNFGSVIPTLETILNRKVK